MKKKVLAVVAAACSMGMLLAGCGSSGDDTAADGDMIITAYASEPQNTLIPGNTNETGGGKPLDLLFSRLVTFDADGNAVNEVAKSIEPNDDATQYTITLQDGWTFTDGTAVTAESFTRAWSYVANAANAQLCSSFFSTIEGYDELQDADNLDGTEQLSGLTVVDDLTFTVDLNQSDSVFAIKVGYTAFAPLPESFYDDPDAFGENPVGNGPYAFDGWDHDSEIRLVKNESYIGTRTPQNDGITFVIYTDDDAAYADIEAGNLNVMESVPTSASATFEEDENVQAYNQAGAVFQSFTIPSSLEHFDVTTEEGQLRRQAISMAIDRESICDSILNGLGTPAVDFTSPKIPGYSDSLEGNEVLSYDPDTAQELWQEADAISEFDGQFTIAYNSDGGSKDIYDAIVNSINNTLNDVAATDGDVAATNPYATFSEFREAITNRQIEGAFRTGWQPDYPSAENFLWQLYSSEAADGNGSNDGDYKNDEFDELCLEAAATADEDEMNALYQQAEELLLRDLPAIPLYYSNASGVASLDVENFNMTWQNLPDYVNLTLAE